MVKKKGSFNRTIPSFFSSGAEDEIRILDPLLGNSITTVSGCLRMIFSSTHSRASTGTSLSIQVLPDRIKSA